MAVWRALIGGFSLTGRLWAAMALLAVVFAAVGALATAFLPYEVVEGQVRVSAPAEVSEALRRLGVGLILYALAIGGSLFLLAGVFHGLRRQIRKESFSSADLLALSRAGFFPMLRWGIGFFGVQFAVAAVVGGAIGLLSKDLMQASFSTTLLFVGLALLFSPVILVERACGTWASFRESVRFVGRHPAGTLGLLFGAGFVGAVAWALWLIVALGVKRLQAAMGIAPFSPGLPAFFFGLILVVPQAFLTVYFPAVLYAYYHGKTSP